MCTLCFAYSKSNHRSKNGSNFCAICNANKSILCSRASSRLLGLSLALFLLMFALFVLPPYLTLPLTISLPVALIRKRKTQKSLTIAISRACLITQFLAAVKTSVSARLAVPVNCDFRNALRKKWNFNAQNNVEKCAQTNENNYRITCGEAKKKPLCATAVYGSEMISTNSRPLVGFLRMMAFVIVICFAEVLNMLSVVPSAVKTYLLACTLAIVYSPTTVRTHEARACHRKMHNAELDWNWWLVRFQNENWAQAPSLNSPRLLIRCKPNSIESFILIGNNC